MKKPCSRCIDGRLISGNICGACKGTGEIDKIQKAHLELSLGKSIKWEEDHGFVLEDLNDSIHLFADEAIKIADFISQYHGLNNSIVIVKSDLV